jgi:hypothetical protein
VTTVTRDTDPVAALAPKNRGAAKWNTPPDERAAIKRLLGSDSN